MPAVFRPAFHVNRITTIKSCLNANFPMQTSKYAYLAQFSINTGLRVSGWPLLNHSLVELSGLASFSSVIVPDPESKESSVIYGAGWSAGGEEVKISVWWDFENCNVPTGIPAHKVSLNIVSALRMSGFKGPVTIAAYGDTLQLSRSVQEALCSTGIQIHHVPSGGKESDSSDRAILVDLILWTIDHPPPAHLFLISGDRDFSNTLHRLRMRNYNILLACPTGAHLSATLAGAASNVWQWNSLVRGEGLLARSCFDPKPSDGTSGGSFAIKTLNNNHKTPDGSSGTSGGFKISNNNLKVPDGTYGGGMPKNSTANSKFSDGASGGVQNLKGSNVKISAPPSQSAGWNNVSGEAHFKAATQSKIDSTNVPLGTEENGFGGKLEKGSEEKLGKDLEGKQDNVVEWKSKMEQSAPFEVLQQFDDLLKAHPEGIWVLELQHLMSERTLQFDSDYYGHKKLVPFLLTIPEIVRVERRIAKDNKTWTYFLLSRQLSVTGSNSGSHSENSVEIPQLAPKRISKQLINLLKSHPKGLWLNEFQAQTVARKIEFDSDFYGHHKMIPFLLTMPEIVRVERRLMNDRKTWNYFFLCSQNLSLARVGTAKGLPESSTSEKDVGLMLEGAVCEEKHSKISQVDGLEQNQDSTFNKQLQESGEVLDPKPSERPKVFWKRAWQIFSNPFGENLERHSFHSHDQATGDSGIKGQDGRDLTEEINSSQQYLSLAGFLKRLLKGSGNDVQNAPSSSRSIMESNADSQPFGDSSEKEGHMAEKGKYVDGELKSPSAWGGEEGMKIHVESQNSGLKSAHESFHPKNSSNEKRDGRLGGDCESIQMPASQKLQSDSAVIVDASPEWKNQDDNHQNTWKGFLLHFFKTSLSPLVGNNHKSLVGTEVAGKRVDPPLRRKSDHLRESHIETITEAVQPLSNSTENCHIKLNPLKDQVEKGSKKWKKFLFGISEEHASLAVHSDFQSELEPSQIQKCVLDTAGTWEESNSQIQSSDKVLNAMSSNGLADKVSSNEVTTMQGKQFSYFDGTGAQNW
ncbi:hypothetical protein O6H91_08G023000 [Diphasiastrum complanatum]|uniref:Uncharacterized protein n=3 Tax=Diphasiastrum complanatum TaxID=34168 RepID=A0ACC2CVQ9_DIPCM|nr:hypothetical protein O6H91_08G023000 [Diphasiastrum complanatum]KAJ7546066.1 hypothetical protein O6H91_08G023000 [Diphasiastrum complanatum]KAJ7546067.1 hypothetical protein O6H91_08G023000 [Diphasiastrum complanatum]